MRAIERNHYDLVNILIDKGPGVVSQEDKNSLIDLMRAADNGYIGGVKSKTDRIYLIHTLLIGKQH
jgi:hypothetical protein